MSKSADLAIEVKKLNKSYGDLLAVNDMSFTVQRAKCTGFLGPNGAGKTSLMKVLYGKGESTPNPETSISVLGIDPRKNVLAIKIRTGVVPQEDSLDLELNVEKNLQIYGRLYNLDAKTRKTRIGEMLEFMELGEKRKARVRELSGGMKRRLVIARALLNNPELLILDEPSTGLDPQVRQLIWDKLRALKKMGVTILLTTHYMDEAFQIADDVIIMDKGEKKLQGNPKFLLKEHMEDYVLELSRDTIIEAGDIDTDDEQSNSHIRCESSSERIIWYSNDRAALENIAQKHHQENVMLRQSNLEDLFIKITGRSLNALQ